MLFSIKKYLSLIKFSHTIFALPFALIGFSLAIHSGKAVFNLQKLILVILCMLFARSAAMAFIELDVHARDELVEVLDVKAALGPVLHRLARLLACARHRRRR